MCERERQRERDALEAYKSDQPRYPMALAQMQRMQKTITLSVQGLQLDVESARNALGTQDVNMRENPVFQDVNMRENPVFEDVDMRENPVLQDVEMDECHALQDVKMDECPVLEDVEMRDCPVLRDVRNLRLSLGKRTASRAASDARPSKRLCAAGQASGLPSRPTDGPRRSLRVKRPSKRVGAPHSSCGLEDEASESRKRTRANVRFNCYFDMIRRPPVKCRSRPRTNNDGSKWWPARHTDIADFFVLVDQIDYVDRWDNHQAFLSFWHDNQEDMATTQAASDLLLLRADRAGARAPSAKMSTGRA